MKTQLLLMITIAFLIFGKSYGQADGTLDTSFNPGTGADNNVWQNFALPDGKILIAGGYNNFNGNSSVERITRLNSDGSIDPTFIPATAPNGIGSYNDQLVAVQSDGKILANHSELDFVRLNTNGTLDTSFSGGYFNNVIHDIAQQSDGKILVCGRFTQYKGLAVPNFIVRLNADGTRDNTFNTFGTGFAGTATPVAIDVMAVQTDGKIIVGGNFETYNGQPQSFLARLNTDGSLDTSFNVTTQFSTGSGVLDLAIQFDGKIIVGGTFTYTSAGQSKYNIVRLNTDGTQDTTFDVGVFSLAGYTWTCGITTIVPQASGKVIVGGTYTAYNGQPQKGIARLNNDGSLDSTFNTGTGFTDLSFFQAPEVYCLSMQPDGKIIVSGNFKSYNGQSIIRTARLHSSGPPAAPSNLTAVPYNSILLNWQDNSNNEDGFNIYSATNINGPWSLITTTAANTTSYIHSGLTNGVEYFYRVSAFNSNGASSYSNTSSAVENTLAVSEIDREKMMIYPNPANGFVKISNIHQNSKITVYDLSGKIVHSEKSKASETTINSENFVSGVYYVLIESNEGKITKKIIVKH